MKLFVASTALASLLSVCSGQDFPAFEDAQGNFRTPDCVTEEADELPALAGGGGNNQAFAQRFQPGLGRKKRDADGELGPIEKYDPKTTPFVWYLNADAKNGDDCGARFEGQDITEGGVYTDNNGVQVALNQGPVLVPLGTYDVCVKFFKANRWFYTSGSNAPCSADNKCCEWFPPKQCNRRTRVPIWFEKPAAAASCSAAYVAGAKPVLGVEYLQGKTVSDQTTVCVFKNAEAATDGNEEADFQEVPATVVYCGGNCCIFN